MTEHVEIDAKIIERIQKLFALAGNNPNEHERAAAAEKANALLAQYNLSMSQVQGKKDGERTLKAGETKVANNYNEHYFVDLWQRVAKMNFCYYMRLRPNKKKRETFHYLIGTPTSVAAAEMMANYLCETMKRQAAAHAKAAGRTDFNFKNSFLYGISDRLIKRLYDIERALREGRATTTNADSGEVTNLPALVPVYQEHLLAQDAFMRQKYGMILVSTEAEKAANSEYAAKIRAEREAQEAADLAAGKKPPKAKKGKKSTWNGGNARRNMDEDAYETGVAAGERVRINPALKGG